jgi:hypothetical protein
MMEYGSETGSIVSKKMKLLGEAKELLREPVKKNTL